MVYYLFTAVSDDSDAHTVITPLSDAKTSLNNNAKA